MDEKTPKGSPHLRIVPKEKGLKEKKEAHDVDMNGFRKEAEGIRSNGKLAGITAEEIVDLTEDDAKMWYEVQNYELMGRGSLTREQFRLYENEVKSSGKDARMIFFRMLAQILSAIWINEELKNP